MTVERCATELQLSRPPAWRRYHRQPHRSDRRFRGTESAYAERVKPETRTVTELFERDVRYVVPLYQRPYVWRKRSVGAAWEDIRVYSTTSSSGQPGQTATGRIPGAIVLDQETQAPVRSRSTP